MSSPALILACSSGRKNSRRRFTHIGVDDVQVLRELDEISAAAGDAFERDLRRWHRSSKGDLLEVATPECELGPGVTIDELGGQNAARFAFGTGGGHHRRPRMAPHA